jgi:formylmethanofuran dehydrogenase subunit A
LAPGADADVTIYTTDPNPAVMFELPRCVIHAGRVVCEHGEIREPLVGKTLFVEPDYDVDVEPDISQWFDKNYSIQLRNYPIDDEELDRPERVPCG